MGVQERKILEKELRRKSILNAGKKLFKKIGFIDTSMDMVAAEAQLSKGTLYLYFKNKDDLYATCVLEDGLNQLAKYFEVSEQANRSIVDTIISYTDDFFRFKQEYPDLFNLMIGVNSASTIELNNISAETREKMEEMQKKIFRQRVEFFQKGIDEGVLDENISTCYAVVQLWVSITGALHLSQKEQLHVMFENIDSKELIRDIAKIFIMAYTKDDSLRVQLMKEIWENAVKQAPSSLEFHAHLNKENKISDINQRIKK